MLYNNSSLIHAANGFNIQVSILCQYTIARLPTRRKKTCCMIVGLYWILSRCQDPMSARLCVMRQFISYREVLFHEVLFQPVVAINAVYCL